MAPADTLNVIPQCLELPTGVTVEVFLDLSGAAVDHELWHPCSDIVARWISNESSVEFGPKPAGNQVEVDAGGKLRVSIPQREFRPDSVALTAVEPCIHLSQLPPDFSQLRVSAFFACALRAHAMFGGERDA